MHRHALMLSLVPAFAMLFGCTPGSPTPPPAVPVKGTVNLNGKPMPSGEIRFNTAGFPGKAIEIKAGAFSGEAAVGKAQVDVVHMKETGVSTTEPKVAITVNTVDPKFSGPKSMLSAEVTKGGANDFKFDVTSK